MGRTFGSSMVLSALVLATACSKEKAPEAPAGSATALVKNPHAGMAMPANMPTGAAAATNVRGKVQEKIDAAGYSYLRLATATGDAWAAVPEATAIAIGDDVGIANPMPMNGFESKTLGRKFDLVYFGTIDGGAAMGAAGVNPHADMAPGGTLPAGHPSLGAPKDVGDVKVEKAATPDGRTVGEVFAQKAALKEQGVSVRGKVVKFTSGVLGKNWIHLRDGSGAAGEDDLTVTTLDTAAVGEVVTAKGTVRLEKDFGAGYAYPVIVEEASITK